ncbi:hypothetical protein HDU93_007386 [Gonapodya sp. JEL0774]|nr:hypothetical protein HDU93_007386 [Gonapodya sp. JEL0774]
MRRNYKWIIPLEDYLADTLMLQVRLADSLSTTNRNIIGIAVGIFIVMCVTSALLVEALISKPMHLMLEATQKGSVQQDLTYTLIVFALSLALQLQLQNLAATKFDFSMVREGNMDEMRSLISEVQHLRQRFMAMLRVFADALKQNKSLIAGSKPPGVSVLATSSEK